MYYAIDRGGALSNLRRTPTGGFLVDARLARTGKMDYPLAEGGAKVHVNTPEVLQAALDEVHSLPVTNRHPPEFVTADTYQQYSAGHPVGQVTFDGEYICATLAVQATDLIRDVELGVAREVSMGYSFDGVVVDGVLTRTRIQFNHIAIVPSGRAGACVSLVLDSNEIPNQDEVKVALKINGADVADDKAQAAIDSLEGQLAAALAERDLLKVARDETAAALAVAVSDEAFSAKVAERDALKAAEDAAAALAVVQAEKRKRVSDAYPKLELADKSEDYIDALDAALELRAAADPEGLGAVKDASHGGVVDDEAPAVVLDARSEMLARNRALNQKR